MTVRKKLFAAMAGMVAVMSLIYAGITIFVVKGMLDRFPVADRSEEIREMAELYLDYYERNGSAWEGVEADREVAAYFERNPDRSALLLAPDGATIARAGEAPTEMVEHLGRAEKLSTGGRTAGILYYHDDEAANLRILQLGVGSSVTVLTLAVVIVIGLAALLAAWRLSGRLTAPIRALMPAIERLGRGELGAQAPVRGKDEFGQLAAAFNAMSGQLERAEAARRSMTADIAHELRTPLAIIRGKLDNLQARGQSVEPEQLLPLQDELIRLTRLVGDLHQLSLADAKKLPLEPQPTVLSELLRKVAERAALEAEIRNVRLAIEGEEPPRVVRLDPNRMTQVFLNLIMNALRHTPAGGAVAIRAEPEKPGGPPETMVRVTIEDTGTGIAPEHLPHIFDRFYRADEDRSRSGGGMGLGLAIAKAIVMAHGGTIEAESAPGEGTRMIVRLPAERG